MGSPTLGPAISSFAETTGKKQRSISAPIIEDDTDPLLTAQERKRVSDGREEDDGTQLRWPVRYNSASSDPVTRDRRVQRIGSFIDKAKQRRASYREPLRKPSDGSSIRRVRTAPTPVRRRSSASVSNLLWLTRPRSRDGAESLLRRVGHHIKVRSQPEGDRPGSEESIGSSQSAPEVPVGEPSSSSSVTPERSTSRHYHHCLPSLHLCAYRTPYALKQDSEQSNHGSTSTSSLASIKSACADTATTLADVHVVKVSPHRERRGYLTPGQATPSPSMHIVESGHGSYRFFWDDPPSSNVSNTDADSTLVEPDENFPTNPTPTGLQQVNSKLEEWCFAARDCTISDKNRCHPRFRTYVEVYQDDDEPQFDLEDNKDALFITPPNSKQPTPSSNARRSRHTSETETNTSNASPPSPHDSHTSPSSSPSHHTSSDEDRGPYFQSRRTEYYDHLLIPSGYYSPRPTKSLTAADRLKPQSRSLSNLSNTSGMSDNANGLLSTHRDSVTLLAERCLPDDEVELPVANPWTHRDSVALTKERMRKKHANDNTGEVLVGGVGILKGVGKGGFERTVPLDIPRIQQVTFVGALSPIADSSPPKVLAVGIQHERKIDDLAGRV